MWVTMFPSVPAQVFCVNYRNSLSSFVKYWGLCKLFKGIVSEQSLFGGQGGDLSVFFFYLAFILTKADKSSEPVDFYAVKTSKEI